MLDLKEEKQYDQLRKLGQRLHIPIPEAFWKLEVFDKNGKLLQTHDQRSHSWTRNAYNAMFSNLASVDLVDNLFGVGKLSGKSTAGVVLFGAKGAVISDGSFETTARGYYGAPGVIRGIQVGSGINAESFEDFVLQTLLTEGTGAGQISYTASEAVDKSYAGLVWTNTLIRYFNNNSAPAGDRDINEVAINARFINFGTAADKDVLVTRDHLGATVTVPSTGQLKVTYTIQLTYPA